MATHSITSSARPSSGSGTVSPSVLAIDDQLEFGRLQDRQVGGLLALENPAGVDAGLTVRFLSIAAVAHQTSGRGERAPLEDRGYSVVDRQCGELLGPAVEDCIGADHERAGSQLGQGCEDRIEIAFGVGMQDMQLHSEDAGRRLQVSQYGLGIGIGWVEARLGKPKR
jgi:hypothetical protein